MSAGKSGEGNHVRRTTYPFVPERIPKTTSDGGVLSHLDTEVLQLLTICDDYDQNQLQQILLESGCYSGQDPVFDEIGEPPSENAVAARETVIENFEAVGNEMTMTTQHEHPFANERIEKSAEFRALNRTMSSQPSSARNNRRRYEHTQQISSEILRAK